MQNFTSRKRSGLLWLHPQNFTESSDCIPFPTNSVINQSKGRICGVFAFKMKACLKRKKKNHCWGKTIILDPVSSESIKCFLWDSVVKLGAQWLHTLRFWDSAVSSRALHGQRGKRARKCEITQTTSWKQHGWKTQLKYSPALIPGEFLGFFSIYFKFIKKNILTGHWNWSLKEINGGRREWKNNRARFRNYHSAEECGVQVFLELQ